MVAAGNSEYKFYMAVYQAAGDVYTRAAAIDNQSVVSRDKHSNLVFTPQLQAKTNRTGTTTNISIQIRLHLKVTHYNLLTLHYLRFHYSTCYQILHLSHSIQL